VVAPVVFIALKVFRQSDLKQLFVNLLLSKGELEIEERPTIALIDNLVYLGDILVKTGI